MRADLPAGQLEPAQALPWQASKAASFPGYNWATGAEEAYETVETTTVY